MGEKETLTVRLTSPPPANRKEKKMNEQERLNKMWLASGIRRLRLSDLSPRYRHESNIQGMWLYPDGKRGGIPDLDYNNLMKYVFPAAIEKVSKDKHIPTYDAVSGIFLSWDMNSRRLLDSLSGLLKTMQDILVPEE